jgi:hypothetical protein
MEIHETEEQGKNTLACTGICFGDLTNLCSRKKNAYFKMQNDVDGEKERGNCVAPVTRAPVPFWI